MPGVIAKINRETGDLFLNPIAWRKLTPAHRDFVLLHEEGHFVLQDPTERGANAYAVNKYIKQATTTDDYGHRITVMSDLLMKESHMIDLSALGSIVGDIFTGLASIGIGSKSRIKELEATEEVLKSQANAQKDISDNSTQNQLLIFGAIGLILIISIVIYFKLKNKK